MALIDTLQTGADGGLHARASQAAAELQGARLWAGAARIVSSSVDEGRFVTATRSEAARDVATISITADIVARHLDWLDRQTHDLVIGEIRRRPDRWRVPLRNAVSTRGGASQAHAARMLDEVGALEDIALLRNQARATKGGHFPPAAGRALSRRLAPLAFIDDLGRVRISIGGRSVDGTGVRRKVMALICFLLTKPKFAAARDEVLEAIWPDLEPSTALNSLNQTVYFLRRVFEPQFSEDTTPGYVGQDGETLWLDWDLVLSRSRKCRDLVRVIATPADPILVMELADAYHGRFALDFLYEDWASTFRDSLHAAYLKVVELALRSDTDSGHYERGIKLAQVAIDADPEAEELQMALTRLYRFSGSLAAASEQYQSYARSQRELGMEPEAFDHI